MQHHRRTIQHNKNDQETLVINPWLNVIFHLATELLVYFSFTSPVQKHLILIAFADRVHDSWAWLLAGYICQEIGILFPQYAVPSLTI